MILGFLHFSLWRPKWESFRWSPPIGGNPPAPVDWVHEGRVFLTNPKRGCEAHQSLVSRKRDVVSLFDSLAQSESTLSPSGFCDLVNHFESWPHGPNLVITYSTRSERVATESGWSSLWALVSSRKPRGSQHDLFMFFSVC